MFSLFDLANIAVAGFSAVSAVLLLLAYALLISVPGKSIYSVGSCVALVTALTAIRNQVVVSAMHKIVIRDMQVRLAPAPKPLVVTQAQSAMQ